MNSEIYKDVLEDDMLKSLNYCVNNENDLLNSLFNMNVAILRKKMPNIMINQNIEQKNKFCENIDTKYRYNSYMRYVVEMLCDQRHTYFACIVYYDYDIAKDITIFKNEMENFIKCAPIDESLLVSHQNINKEIIQDPNTCNNVNEKIKQYSNIRAALLYDDKDDIIKKQQQIQNL
ncbi:hypothetical protein RFI_35172 [Reticulomyxa filosa]|uniref:Uncharacterized protein n=1 Tax=Reticulomyxa filosa TaxID=46433 RepID=X6LKW6_RETFI|nr:hypothetical protein RFI_35172 [Reticulomyxa filosa]|eukprot:ETO02264.1 hypothetical protein RFI_35172 [Reticulomyxa filosa]